MFTSSQSWTVPAGVSSAFVTMAGGGSSGAGWRMIGATATGSSGGYLFSQPVNFVAGETISVLVGLGGKGHRPYNTGVPVPSTPYYVFAPPLDGDNGLGGYPGGTSMLVSPIMGTLLECSGGSGAIFDGVDNYSGGLVPGPKNGGTTGSGYAAYSSPNRAAVGAYATPGGPGACGPAMYGIGNAGTLSWNVTAGDRTGGKTPFGYGSGGDINIGGCYVSTTTLGTCIYPFDARDGIVFIDVLY